MSIVIACWVLAMVAGLLWARRYAVLCIIATVLAFFLLQRSMLARWTGWLELLAFTITPWLLTAYRQRQQAIVKRLHAEEAVQMSHLSEAARALLSLQSSTQQMETQITEMTDLYHVTKETSRALRLDELFSASLNIAPRLLAARGLRLIDLSGDNPRVLRARPGNDGQMALLDEREQPANSEGTARIIEAERTIIDEARAVAWSTGASVQVLPCNLPEGVSTLSWATLWRERRPIGVLVADELPKPQLKTLSIVANQLSLQCSRIHLYRQVEALAVTDALTGLFVRGHFLELADEELVRSKRHNLPCTLLMMDLDLFKQKNDAYGHLVGDVILKDVAKLLQHNLREVDMIARFGGEEFILLLIETQVEPAMPIAQRLRQLVEVHPIRAYDELLTQTISVGVAGFPEHAQTLDALIERADQALYAAKRTGRNRVVPWSERLGKT